MDDTKPPRKQPEGIALPEKDAKALALFWETAFSLDFGLDGDAGRG